MKRALPALVLSVAALIPIWRYTPSIGSSAQPPPSGAEALSPPAPSSNPTAPPASSSDSSAPPDSSPGSSAPPTTATGPQVIAGSTVPTEKGDVQVEVTLTAGRITAVRALKAPPHPQTTAALPKLVEATLEAQSADIDAVTGATITSDGYRESLQAALDLKNGA
ncbi:MULTISPECIES: FMN-binding protein [unclassified Streptomyces]|uniref:FMN-binding protein n=1 Tax=unclassified Streptomyces TaxID=2593676 RepID=UPI001655DE79|nr:FMN-binding protein [Streptomyces sp. CB02980]MCB8901155.1 FMN-binding protein [Streptomyces sp. CB02980]